MAWRRGAKLGVCVLASCLSVWTAAKSARAQTHGAERIETGPAHAVVTPPKLERFVEAAYPAEAQARGLEADVVLALEIDENGAVTNANVAESAGHGFDEAARAAALNFTFVPANRDGRPVKSRILYRYSFHFRPPEPAEQKPALALLRARVSIAGSQTPVAGARVRVLRGAKLVEELVTNSDGAFATKELEPGDYSIAVHSEGFDDYSATEHLDAGEELSLRYGLQPTAEPAELTVTVHGARPTREVTRRTVTRRELSRVPGTSGDALRAIQNLPGVARPPALSGVLVVRGNADQTTPVMVDGLWLPNVYHFGGLSSVIPTEMLDEINFYPGNFSVRFGRALAGVVDAHLRETRGGDRYHGLLQVDLIDARGLLEGPVPFVKGWNFIGGLRRSHIDAWLAPLLKNRDTYITAAPVYYDYQFILDNHPTPDSYLRIGLIGFDDRFRLVNQTGATGGQLDTVNASWGVGTIYQSKLSERTRLNITMSAARNHVAFSLSTLSANTTALGLIGRGELEWKMWKNATLRSGYELLLAPYNVKGQLPEPTSNNAPSTGSFVTAPPQKFDRSAVFLVPALFTELDAHPNKRTQVVTGVRVDYTRDTGRLDVAPRITARYDLVPGFPKTTLKGGTGLFFQAPGLVELVLKDDQTSLRSQRAFQNSLGIEQELTDRVKLSAEGFLNLLDNLVSRGLDDRGVVRYNNYGKGRIYGGEFMLRYEADERFFGWLSYTLSRSERTWVPGEPSHLFYLDQTHILTALGSYTLGRGWEIGMRFRYVSGNLYTPCPRGIYSSNDTGYLCVSGPLFSERLPPFHQLDIRVDKKFKFKEWALSAYLDLINAYNRKNPDF
ncbi:MAG TPA: TonB-dependent receptor, partial [Polyangiaceae bacterium]|nr:TonB-dependent receptor [Polyangiaceae bacterium]